jgi:hypothetical protein
VDHQLAGAVLEKKGDLSKAGNYRGIMMLEIPYKVVANVLKVRLGAVFESLGEHVESRTAFVCGSFLVSAACRLSVLGPQNRRHVRSSRHVLIEQKHSNDARGLVVLLID